MTPLPAPPPFVVTYLPVVNDHGEPIYVFVRWNGVRLSFDAVEDPTPRGHCGACGQIADLVAASRPAPYWSAAGVARLVDTWRRWHLNDMRAGCEHQRRLDTPPAIGDPCPTCGYRYGSRWLHEDVPPAVVRDLLQFPVPTKLPPQVWRPDPEG